jgi:putative heme-binding domain-containing protein
MWALTTSGGATEQWLLQQLNHPDENVRVWAIKFLTDDGKVSDRAREDFVRLARNDPSSMVRLSLASTLQRLPAQNRVGLARALLAHTEDATDHNLPLMLWYGIEPLAAADPTAFGELEWQTQIPLLRKFIARRVAEEIERHPALVNQLIASVAQKGSASQQLDVLEGMCLALRGWRKAPKPPAWDAAAIVFLNHPDPRVRDRATELGAVFGDGRALDELRRVALDNSADPTGRRLALQTLFENRAPDLLPVILKLLGDRIMARAAVQALATFNDADLARKLVGSFNDFRRDVRPDVIATLCSRAAFARVLLEAVAAKEISRHDLSAYDARQIHNLGDPQLDELLTKVWGEFRTTNQEKQRQMADLRTKLTPERLQAANLQHGHELFLKTCGVCHRLYGEGAAIGPDLTGSGRKDLGYLLENVLDPSAVVAADYKMSIVELKDDRVLTGIVGEKKERTITVQTANEKVVVQRAEIQSERMSQLSMMPEGLLDSLKEDEVRDLLGFLMTPSWP